MPDRGDPGHDRGDPGDHGQDHDPGDRRRHDHGDHGALVHRRSAWNINSANFAFWAFSEVR